MLCFLPISFIFAFAITFDALFYLLRMFQLACDSVKDIGET